MSNKKYEKARKDYEKRLENIKDCVLQLVIGDEMSTFIDYYQMEKGDVEEFEGEVIETMFERMIEHIKNFR